MKIKKKKTYDVLSIMLHDPLIPTVYKSVRFCFQFKWLNIERVENPINGKHIGEVQREKGMIRRQKTFQIINDKHVIKVNLEVEG